MSGKVNPDAVLGLQLYAKARSDGKDYPTGWVATSYDYDDYKVWIQFEHRNFSPWDTELSDLEIVIDLKTGKQYLREK